MHKLDILAVLTQLAGLGILASDATFQTYLTTLLGPSATKYVAFFGLTSLVASTILRIIGSPSTSQGAPK